MVIGCADVNRRVVAGIAGVTLQPSQGTDGRSCAAERNGANPNSSGTAANAECLSAVAGSFYIIETDMPILTCPSVYVILRDFC